MLQTEQEQGFFVVMRHQLPTNESVRQPIAAFDYVNSVLCWDPHSALGCMSALVITERQSRA